MPTTEVLRRGGRRPPPWVSWDGSPRFLVLACLYHRDDGLDAPTIARLTTLDEEVVVEEAKKLVTAKLVARDETRFVIEPKGEQYVRSAPPSESRIRRDYAGIEMRDVDETKPLHRVNFRTSYRG